MSGHNDPLSPRSMMAAIVAGLFVTIVGGLILNRLTKPALPSSVEYLNPERARGTSAPIARSEPNSEAEASLPVLFRDDFNRATSASLGQEWRLLMGTMLQIDSGRVEAPVAHQVEDAVIVSSLAASELTIDADWSPADGDCGVDGRLIARVRDVDNYYGARLAHGSATEAVIIYKVADGVYTQLARVDPARSVTYPFHLRFTLSGNSLEFHVIRPGAKTVTLRAIDSSLRSGSAGLVAFADYCGTAARSTYDNFVVRGRG